MGDELDDCECVCSSHEYAMQRLLSFIRQSQSWSCTDTECIDVSGRVQQGTLMDQEPRTGNSSEGFIMMTMLVVLAVFMYLMSPESIMKFTNTKRGVKQRDDPRDGSSPPPPPPPSGPPAVN